MKDFVSIQLSESGPMYIQIAEQIETQILDAELHPGQRLPTIRKFAAGLDVNTITIVKAYEYLEEKGLITKIKGSGVYVGNIYDRNTQDHIQLKSTKKPIPITDLNNEELYLDSEINLMNGGQIALRNDVINFSTTTPTPELFPVEAFKEALNQVLDEDGGAAFGYAESNGYLPLRNSISQFFSSEYNIQTPAERLQIISGAQQGIDIAAKALLTSGDPVLVEDPSYTGALAVFKSRGAKVIGIPVLSSGIDLDKLEKNIAFYKPKLFYCMPDFQNPTGYQYTVETRQKILDLARNYDFFIIEDDYVSDLYFNDTTKLPTIKSLESDAEDKRVIYIKSFSKLLMPGLRIGFLSAPDKIYRDILQAKHLTDISSSGLIQRAFYRYLKSGNWNVHVRMMQDIYKKRYELLSKELEQLKEFGVLYELPEGGFNFWLHLPDAVTATRLFRTLSEKGVSVTPGSVFKSGMKDFESNIRISFAAVHEDDIHTGVLKIAQSIQHILNYQEYRKVINPIL